MASISDNLASETKTRHPLRWAASESVADNPHIRRKGGLGLGNPLLTPVNSRGARETSKTGHRATTSLSSPFPGSSVSSPWTASPATRQRQPHTHQRSVSIMSMGSPDVRNEGTQRAIYPSISRPTINHGRSTSHQGHLKKSDGNHDGPSPSSEAAELQAPSWRASNSAQNLQTRGRVNRADAQFRTPAKSPGHAQVGSRHVSPSSQHYRFPRSLEERPAAISPIDRSRQSLDASAVDEHVRAANPSRLESMRGLGSETEVLPGTSVTDSNRSSGEFQSLSNQSQETFLSEQASLVRGRRMFLSPSTGQQDGILSTPKPKRVSETLLMGYAQVNATFSLDGALVDQTPFDEVKRKGFLGGQAGGGVVGVKTPSNVGGLLGGLSLTSIGESISGLLTGGDLSSLKEMKDAIASRAIPLLSTPQSLLFVDLNLMPGEEKSYSFRYTLPKGLPASYKGRTIKIVYNLIVGVQGAPGEKAMQRIRSVNIPFRVFSGVNDEGEIFGHDLMQPYVILHDSAQIEAANSPTSFPEPVSNASGKDSEASSQDFLAYVETLLNKRRRRQSSSTTLEPSGTFTKMEGGGSAKQAIDRTLFISKQKSSSHQSLNRFDIARNGQRIATVTLDRTLYRLGESLTASVDFSNPQMPCYALRCFLETTETVNPALALRSAASITRLSRRVYHSQSENTLFAERITFTPSIPITASPTLLTSGVNLDWALRLEFVTTRATNSTNEKGHFASKDLLEIVANDERGLILAAVETLQCETFEVSIPITVYGDTVVAAMDAERIVGFPI